MPDAAVIDDALRAIVATSGPDGVKNVAPYVTVPLSGVGVVVNVEVVVPPV
jgi:hypothetical protein